MRYLVCGVLLVFVLGFSFAGGYFKFISSVMSPELALASVSSGVGTSVPLGASVGADGTWCYDSMVGGGIYKSGYCMDGSGTHSDYCEANSTARQYYCGGTWNGVAYNNFHCEAGGYVCSSWGVGCYSGACGASPTSVGLTNVPTSVPSIVPSVIPTIGSTMIPTKIPTAIPTIGITSIPTKIPTAVPTVGTTIAPTVVPTLILSPVPTTSVGSTYLGPSETPIIPSPTSTLSIGTSGYMAGDDGTWCFDSENSGSLLNFGYCNDKSGNYSDFCSVENTVKKYVCVYKKDGKEKSSVHCEATSFSCGGLGVSCQKGACIKDSDPVDIGESYSPSPTITQEQNLGRKPPKNTALEQLFKRLFKLFGF